MKSIKYLFLALIATVMVGCTEDTTEFEPGPVDSDSSAQLYFPEQSTSILLMPTDTFESTFTLGRAGATPAATYSVQISDSSDGIITVAGQYDTIVDDETITLADVTFAEGQEEAYVTISFLDAEIAESYAISFSIYSDEAAVYKTTSLSLSVMVSYTWTLVVGDDGDTTATWTSGLLNNIFSCNSASKDVSLYEAAEIPGYYRIRNIYDTNFVSSLWGCDPEEEEGYALDPSATEDYYTYIHAEDPNAVWVEYCDTGYFCYYDDYGNFVFGSYVPDQYTNGLAENYGVLADGVITFPTGSFVVGLSAYGNWLGGDLTITMPGTTMVTVADPSEMYGMTYNGCFTDIAGVQYAVIDFDVNETTTSVKYALIDSASVDVETIAAGIIDGSIESVETTEFTGVYVELPGAGLYSVVGVTFGGEYGEAGEVSSFTNVVAFKISGSSDEDDAAGFTLGSGTATLSGYSYYDEAWYTEDLTIEYDSATGEVVIYGLFYGYSAEGIVGTYDAEAQTISIPDWQSFGTFSFSSGDYDVYFANATGEDDIVFTLNSTETAFETSQMWGYYLDEAGWYDVYTSATFDVELLTKVSASYTLYGYSYYDEAYYSEDVVISLDSAAGTASVAGLFYGYSTVAIEGTYDAAAQTISIPDWQSFGTFSFSSGDYDVYFANAVDATDIVFTMNSVGTAYETSQWWGYYLDEAGWYDVYTTSYFAPAVADEAAAAAPSVYAKGADKLDLMTVSAVSARTSAKSVVAPSAATSLKSTAGVAKAAASTSMKPLGFSITSVMNSVSSSKNTTPSREIKSDAVML